jgi:hypothetical protein
MTEQQLLTLLSTPTNMLTLLKQVDHAMLNTLAARKLIRVKDSPAGYLVSLTAAGRRAIR